MVVLIPSGLVSRTGGSNPPISIYTTRIHIKGRECGMEKYEVNWFRYIGLITISILIEIHLGGTGNFLISFLLFFSAGMISMERME